MFVFPFKTTGNLPLRFRMAVVMVSVTDKNKLPVPVAGIEIRFNLKGPGKILRLGNGAPTSLEKVKFIEDIRTAAITGLKEKPVQSVDDGLKALSEEDSTWKEAFTKRNYKNLAPAYLRHCKRFDFTSLFTNCFP